MDPEPRRMNGSPLWNRTQNHSSALKGDQQLIGWERRNQCHVHRQWSLQGCETCRSFQNWCEHAREQFFCVKTFTLSARSRTLDSRPCKDRLRPFSRSKISTKQEREASHMASSRCFARSVWLSVKNNFTSSRSSYSRCNTPGEPANFSVQQQLFVPRPHLLAEDPKQTGVKWTSFNMVNYFHGLVKHWLEVSHSGIFLACVGSVFLGELICMCVFVSRCDSNYQWCESLILLILKSWWQKIFQTHQILFFTQTLKSFTKKTIKTQTIFISINTILILSCSLWRKNKTLVLNMV